MPTSVDHWPGTSRLIVWFAIAVFVLLSGMQAHKPLHLDNADLPVWGKAVADTGAPVAYRGEDRAHDLFLYHTPLYLYVLGAWYTVVGYGPAQTRLLNVGLTLLLGVIVLEIVRHLHGREVRDRVKVLFWPLFLLNPYTLQCAAIADIDTSIYGPLLCGFMLAVIRLLWQDAKPRSIQAWHELIWPTLLLALCFWAKLTTVWLLVPFTLTALLLRSRAAFSVQAGLSITAGGFAIFVLTYRQWSHSFGADWLTVFFWLSSYPGSTTGGFMGRVARFAGTSNDMLPFIFRWTGFLPWLGLGVFLVMCGAGALRRRDHAHPDGQVARERAQITGAVFGMAVLATLYYAGQRYTFGNAPYKYVYVFWPLVCMALALTAIGAKPDGTRWVPSLSVQSRRALTAAVLMLIIVIGWTAALTLFRDDYLRGGAITPLSFWLLPTMVLAGALVAWTLRHYRSAAGLVWALIALHVGFQSAICVHQAQQPYSTTYNYGQLGLAATASFIQLHTNPQDVVFCMKDLGPIANRRYIESYGYMYGGAERSGQAIETIKSRVRLVVATEQIGEDQLIMNSALKRWVETNCRLIKSLGNYRIYEVSRPQIPSL